MSDLLSISSTASSMPLNQVSQNPSSSPQLDDTTTMHLPSPQCFLYWMHENQLFTKKHDSPTEIETVFSQVAQKCERLDSDPMFAALGHTRNIKLTQRLLSLPYKDGDPFLAADTLKNANAPLRCLYYTQLLKLARAQKNNNNEIFSLIFFLCHEIDHCFSSTQFSTIEDRCLASWNQLFYLFSTEILTSINALLESNFSCTYADFTKTYAAQKFLLEKNTNGETVYSQKTLVKSFLRFQVRLQGCQESFTQFADKCSHLEASNIKFVLGISLCFFGQPFEVIKPHLDDYPEQLKEFLLEAYPKKDPSPQTSGDAARPSKDPSPQTSGDVARPSKDLSSWTLGDILYLWARTFTKTTQDNVNFSTIRRNILTSKKIFSSLPLSARQDIIHLLMKKDVCHNARHYLCSLLGMLHQNLLYHKAIVNLVCYSSPSKFENEEHLKLVNEILPKLNGTQIALDIWECLRQLEPVKGFADRFRSIYEATYLVSVSRTPHFSQKLNLYLTQVQNDKQLNHAYLHQTFFKITNDILQQKPLIITNNLIEVLIEAAIKYESLDALHLLYKFQVNVEEQTLFAKSKEPSFDKELLSRLAEIASNENLRSLLPEILYKLSLLITTQGGTAYSQIVIGALTRAALKYECQDAIDLLHNFHVECEIVHLSRKIDAPDFEHQLTSCIDSIRYKPNSISRILFGVASNFIQKGERDPFAIAALSEAAHKFNSIDTLNILAKWLKDILFVQDSTLEELIILFSIPNQSEVSWSNIHYQLGQITYSYLASTHIRPYFKEQQLICQYRDNLSAQISELMHQYIDLPLLFEDNGCEALLHYVQSLLNHFFEFDVPPPIKNFAALTPDVKFAHYTLLMTEALSFENAALTQEYALLQLFEFAQHNCKSLCTYWNSSFLEMPKISLVEYLGIRWHDDQIEFPLLTTSSVESFPAIKQLCEQGIYQTEEIESFLQRLLNSSKKIQAELDRAPDCLITRRNALAFFFNSIFAENPLFVNPFDKRYRSIYEQIPVHEDYLPGQSQNSGYETFLFLLHHLLDVFRPHKVLTASGILQSVFLAREDILTLDDIKKFQEEQERLSIPPEEFAFWLKGDILSNTILIRYLLVQKFPDTPLEVANDFHNVYSQLLELEGNTPKLSDTLDLLHQAKKLIPNMLKKHFDQGSETFKQYQTAALLPLIDVSKPLVLSASCEELIEWITQFTALLKELPAVEGIIHHLYPIAETIMNSDSPEKDQSLLAVIEHSLIDQPLYYQALELLIIGVIESTYRHNNEIHTRYIQALFCLINHPPEELTIRACLKQWSKIHRSPKTITKQKKQLSQLQKELSSCQHQITEFTRKLKQAKKMQQMQKEETKLTAKVQQLEHKLKVEKELTKKELAAIQSQIQGIEKEHQSIKSLPQLNKAKESAQTTNLQLLNEVQKVEDQIALVFRQIDSERVASFKQFHGQGVDPEKYMGFQSPVLLTTKALEELPADGLNVPQEFAMMKGYLSKRGWSPEQIDASVIQLHPSDQALFLESDAVQTLWSHYLANIQKATNSLITLCNSKTFSEDVSGTFKRLKEYFESDPLKSISNLLQNSIVADFEGAVLTDAIINKIFSFIESSIKLAFLAKGERHLHNDKRSFRDRHNIITMIQYLLKQCQIKNEFILETLRENGWNNYRTDYAQGVSDQANISVMLRDLADIYAAEVPPIEKDDILTKVAAAREVIASLETLMLTWEAICPQVVQKLRGS